MLCSLIIFLTLLYVWYDLARKYEYGRKVDYDDSDGYAYGYSAYAHSSDVGNSEYAFDAVTNSYSGNNIHYFTRLVMFHKKIRH